MGEFKWTDELVVEFAGDGSRQMREQHESMLAEFKASKLPKPEWKIIKGKDKNGTVHEWQTDVDGCEYYKCSIHSVKRLSDGEVFTVGDESVDALGNVGEIERFSISGDTMYVYLTHVSQGRNEMTVHLKDLKKPWIDKENREFLAKLWSSKRLLPQLKYTPDLRPAANGKVPVWLSPEDLEKLQYFLKTAHWIGSKWDETKQPWPQK